MGDVSKTSREMNVTERRASAKRLPDVVSMTEIPAGRDAIDDLMDAIADMQLSAILGLAHHGIPESEHTEHGLDWVRRSLAGKADPRQGPPGVGRGNTAKED